LADRRILVVAAHPDDEVLGTGATIADLADSGAEVRILILGDGESSRRASEKDKARVQSRADAARRAGRILGVVDISVHDLPDNAFDTVPLLTVIRLIEDELSDFAATDVYTHHGGDLNIDHEITSRAVLTALRPNGGLVPDIYAFEVRSSTDWSDSHGAHPFRPNVWRGVSESAAERKRLALEEYRSEMRPWPHSRSLEAVEALLRHRGAQAGVPAAEAFVLLRSVRTA
jgi:LmbE family N-acetylglucosaminyl deacetylase